MPGQLYQVLYDFAPRSTESTEMAVKSGEVVIGQTGTQGSWVFVERKSGGTGYVPQTFLRVVIRTEIEAHALRAANNQRVVARKASHIPPNGQPDMALVSRRIAELVQSSAMKYLVISSVPVLYRDAFGENLNDVAGVLGLSLHSLLGQLEDVDRVETGGRHVVLLKGASFPTATTTARRPQEPAPAPNPPVSELEDLMQRCGLSEYYPALRREEIDIEVMQHLDLGDLEEFMPVAEAQLLIDAHRQANGEAPAPAAAARAAEPPPAPKPEPAPEPVPEPAPDPEGPPKIPDAFICSISIEIMQDPVVAADGHSYERSFIEEWLQKKDTSPMTNMPLEHKGLTYNRALAGAIHNFLEQHPEYR